MYHSFSSARQAQRRWTRLAMPLVRITNASPVDFARASGHCRAVIKRTIDITNWCKLVAALMICAAVPCSAQVLPQLLAQIASLDRNHAVSLYATSNGVDLVVVHNSRGLPAPSDNQLLKQSPSEQVHVVHLMTGPAAAKQSATLMVSSARNLVPYFSTTAGLEWRTFVPLLPLVYSRPPPLEIAISPLHRSTLLLI